MHDCTIIGDKGYITSTQQLDLFRQANIELEVPMRVNQNTINPNHISFAKREKEWRLSSPNYVDSSTAGITVP